MKKTFENRSPLIKSKEKYLLSFLIAFAVACAIFVPYIIIDKGYFLFFGDFNVQQVPFYKLAHRMVRSGNFGWDFGTDLGANFISSYSFYLLGSPFFWLTIPFPNSFVPHLMGPLLILKFSFASLSAYSYITRFVREKNYALIGAVLYAFSGFSVYNLFYNHFHEAIIYFPLLLLSLELLMKENRRGCFFGIVALSALSNYYFFFGMVVFTILYFIVRVMSGDWGLSFSKGKAGYTWSRLCAVAVESVLGVLASSIILIPSVLGILENTRLESSLIGWEGIVYAKPQRYLYIFSSLFFPPDVPARQVFFTEVGTAQWASVAAWMPVFSMTGVFAWLKVKKGTWQKRLITISAVMAFIPFLNSIYSAFNYNYYARWFYMPILIMALMTAMSLEDKSINLFHGWMWSAFITTSIILVLAFFPNGKNETGWFATHGLFDKDYTDRFWVNCGIAVGGFILMALLLVLKKNSKKTFVFSAIASICIVSILYSSYYIATGNTLSSDREKYLIPTLIEYDDSIKVNDANGELIKASDVDDARFDVYKGISNVSMYMNLRGIQTFHSIVPGSIMEFYDYVGVSRTVNSKPPTDVYALRGLLSVKYLLDYTGDNDSFEGESGNIEMPGFVRYSVNGNSENLSNTIQNSYYIYENKNFVPYGFTYDYYMTQEYCDSFESTDRPAVMMKAMLLDEEQIKKYSDILSDLNTDRTVDEFKRNYLDSTEYKNNCSERAEKSCSSFVTGNSEFTATITLDKDNLVFFSVPYEKGWSATVDGKKVDIEKVNVGFMAVPVTGDGNEHTIHFTYETPGLKIGMIITFSALIIGLLYILLYRKYCHKYQLNKVRHSIELNNGFKIVDYSLADSESTILPDELDESYLNDNEDDKINENLPDDIHNEGE